MSLFLDEKTKEECLRKYADKTNLKSIYKSPCENAYLAGWNECEKHVRESVSDAADLRSCMCSRFIVEIEQLKAENERLKLALAGKTGSCMLCEDAQKEICPSCEKEVEMLFECWVDFNSEHRRTSFVCRDCLNKSPEWYSEIL